MIWKGVELGPSSGACNVHHFQFQPIISLYG